MTERGENEMLAEKTVLITGATGGLGTAVTRAFLDAGALVVGVSRSAPRGDAGGEERFRAVAGEVTSLEGARKVFDAVGGPVDVVVHLVGGFAMGDPVEAVDAAALDKMLDMNLRSAWSVFAAALPGMKERGSGRLLAIGSKAAVEPGALTSAYNVSKAALVALVRSIAVENKKTGVTANIVLPGTMDTPANRAAMPDADPSQWVRPEQVAAMLVHLASDGAAQVNGAVIPVYGSE
jgi:NAD(P)-dependent dehydrogenase (short-subunit alcohol dehydrogenase family)